MSKKNLVIIDKELTEKELGTAMKKVVDRGEIANNACQAHILNNFTALFNDNFYMKENNKTDRIPVFNLPNIKVQVDFLQVLKNNYEVIMNQVPSEEKENFERFVEYLRSQPMCVNCQSCKDVCYNNKAYTQYQFKALCDLRQLYRINNKPHQVIGEIVQETINVKNARLNGSGEIHSKQILDFYIKLAKSNSDTNYYTYTKNYDLLVGKKLPKNLIINLSMFDNEEQVEEYRKILPKNLNVFKVVDSEEFKNLELQGEKNLCYGESCSSCRLCTKKKGITIFVEKH